MSIWASIYEAGVGSPIDRGAVLAGVDASTYPTATEYRTFIDLAAIPAQCVPGHEHDVQSSAVGPWLRLGAGPTEAVLDERAVKGLRDALTEWLDTEKVRAEGDPR